jgi:hypothetical protein
VTNFNLGITPSALARPARLRADRIRHDTLTALARALREDHDGSVQNALDALMDAVGSPRDGEGAEVDARVADVEDLAGMGRPEMPLTAGDVRQLAEQAAAALPQPRPVHGQVAAVRPGRSAA